MLRFIASTIYDTAVAVIFWIIVLIAITIIGLSAKSGYGAEPQFQVINKCKPQITVVNRTTTSASNVKVSTRAPIGHTHTCANGHTWDHSVTDSHNCPVAGCGLFQNYQDAVPRMVNIGGYWSADQKGSPYQVTFDHSLYPGYGSAQGGGCANSSCGISSPPQRSGWYPGKNLGR